MCVWRGREGGACTGRWRRKERRKEEGCSRKVHRDTDTGEWVCDARWEVCLYARTHIHTQTGGAGAGGVRGSSSGSGSGSGGGSSGSDVNTALLPREWRDLFICDW